MITSRQVRAARALLGWTQDMLADQALVALTSLKRVESERLVVRDGTREAVRRALEAAGIVFITSDRGEGLMLMRPSPDAKGQTKRKPAPSRQGGPGA